MSKPQKVLLVDDEQDLLDLYREILSQLPSRPEIITSASGARALALLESEEFNLLVCDLNMPKMDGLQVLSIVRKKYPNLRTVVLTCVKDEQFRSRVYSLGIDMFWHKPGTTEEIKQFVSCMESLIDRQDQTGFRGVQSKSLVDIIQLECLSQSSVLLKITNGPLTGRIWIVNGEIMDAATDDLSGETAFHRILSWRSGNFETLPAEPDHPRTIKNSYQGLLLETAQAQDEALTRTELSPGKVEAEGAPASPLTVLSHFQGVEFVLALKRDAEKSHEARGLENPEPVAKWSRAALERFQSLGEKLQAGPIQSLDGLGPHRHLALAKCQDLDFCVGWQHNLTAGQINESMKKLLALWGS